MDEKERTHNDNDDGIAVLESVLSDSTNFIRDAVLLPPYDVFRKSNLIEFGSRSRIFSLSLSLFLSFSLSPRQHRCFPRVFHRDFPRCSVIDPCCPLVPHHTPRGTPQTTLPACLPALFHRRSRDVKRVRNRLGRSHSRGTISREYIL